MTAFDADRYHALLNEGFRLADQRDFEAAAERYQAAFGMLAPAEHAMSDHHGQYAFVLHSLGRDDEARSQYERALEAAQREEPQPGPVAALARRFLGEHLLLTGSPDLALHVVSPSLACGRPLEAMLRTVEAEALAALGRSSDAAAAARKAVGVATENQRTWVLERVRTLIGSNEEAG
jgi:tetratricopeptide (TPR) repeat protein